MLKVIVADNEKRICRLICMLADWSSLGIEVVATASNGLEALEAIEAYRPDILVTDIHMPGCNGLELIEKSKAIQQQELMTSLKKLGERCRRADVHRTSAFYCSSPRYKNNPNPSPAEIRFGLFFFGAGNRTRTCTLLAVEPKSTESTNSTMPAFCFGLWKLFYHRTFRLSTERGVVENWQAVYFLFLRTKRANPTQPSTAA